MNCPSCNTETPDASAFCSACGKPIPGAAPAGHAPPAQIPPPAAPPRGKGPKVLIIVLILVALLLCCCVAAGGGGWYFYARQQGNAPAGPAAVEGTGSAPPAEGAFAKAEEAVESVLPEADWVYELHTDAGDSRTYVAGPPHSEYAMTIEVVRAGGGWAPGAIGTVLPVGEEGEPGEEAAEAEDVVRRFLDFIQADQPMKAHALCVEPFSYDGASAAYSNGEFTEYEIHGASANPDGSFHVSVTEVWYGQAQESSYLVVPTEDGYRISEVLVE